MKWGHWSLRRKLICACVLMELAVAAVLVYGSNQLLQRVLTDEARFQTRQAAALLGQAIAAPLAQRDYATLQQTLDLMRQDDAIQYLVLRNHRGQVVASSGWDAAQALPARDVGDIDLDRKDTTWHVDANVVVAGQSLGHIDLGLPTARMRQARFDFLWRSVVVGVLALVVSMAVLSAIAMAITRHLVQLDHASQRLAQGDFSVHAPEAMNDEIGRLGASFNAMSAALKHRLAALEASEALQKEHLRTAREEQSRMTALLGAMRSGILFMDPRGGVIYANAAFAQLWSVPEVTADSNLARLADSLAQQVIPEDAEHVRSLAGTPWPDAAANRELRLLDSRIIHQRIQPVTEGTHQGGSIWFYSDVTAERRTQQRARQALRDPLTALLNRLGLQEALQSVIEQAADTGEPLSLLFIDLDDFKHANDVAGHRTGDEILASVARALMGQMRKGEVVARLGGDEFAVLCPRTSALEAAAIAPRLIDAVSSLRFHAAGQDLRVGCSIGVATYPADALTGEDLLACADAAMYEAKHGGKNNWAVFRDDPQRLQAETTRVNWNARLHSALQDGRFVLHFQPVHRATDLQLAHHEAFVRLVDESDPGYLISPAEFIAHAERSGKVRQIDRWVLQACVAKLAATDAGVRIAANLSVRSLEDTSLPGFLRDLLHRYDTDPRRLHLELTEMSAIGDPLAARRLIDALRSLGCAVHLDDFGSGFSSFAHLKLLDVDAIKIDGTFIRHLLSNSSDRLFVAAMIDIAHELNKTVIAQHVEDAATLEVLRGLGVDLVQGFHLNRPSERLVGEQTAPGSPKVGGLEAG